ncbi:Tfp pilus assembly protein PilF [Planktothrix serta PCC 8927]|uniref:Tfp pilus assembly protein PilF n=1 Tax=Planktothrix serta PCC 8927 TaxID=671068 RepID=A0A7Z9C2T4_9CYAN|nr:GNAT family N-acetyltransferase [Planktothrix serta]VXD24589.1 Tfp pilus assembly protein PilF [Planktothrix serta PCC 8927]
MKIDIIDDFQTFNQVRKNWDFVYEADPHANFFLSWVWLVGWLQMVAEFWLILAVKPEAKDSSYVAFFPLKLILEQQDDGGCYTQLYMAGNSVADYTGFLSLPAYEQEVIPAFASYIQQQLVWSRFDIQNILETDQRMFFFLKCFSEKQFEFSQHRILNNGENTDNYIAPYVLLTDDWDQYLQNNVGANTRQKIRRFFRKIESSDEFRITHIDADNVDSHIDILLGLWESKWREKKGDKCDPIMAYIRQILHHCFENNCLYLPVLWRGDKPLCAIANFIDIHQKTMLFVITGRDQTFNNIPTGLILHANAIRYAIQNGFKVYDFLRGNEEYKYYFGAKERRIKHIVAKYKTSPNRKLDIRILPSAFGLTIQHHRENKLTEAEQGYRQILETQSNHPEALFGLGVLMRQKGEYQSAENLLKDLLQIQPNSIKALLSLGNLYQAQDRFSEAIEAYHQVLVLQPDLVAAHNNMGYALQQQGKSEDAIACYQKALKLQPDCVEAEVNLANILHIQGKLSPEKQVHYAAINNDLGCKCKQLGDLKTAIAYYQQSILMNPNLAEAHDNLEQVLKR